MKMFSSKKVKKIIYHAGKYTPVTLSFLRTSSYLYLVFVVVDVI